MHVNAEAGWSRIATNCPTMSHARRESNAGSNVQCVMGYASQTVYKQYGVAAWYGRYHSTLGITTMRGPYATFQYRLKLSSLPS